MYEIMCDCDWDIPGVDALPHHRHRVRNIIRRDHDGYEFETHTDFIEQKHYTLVESEEVVLFSVDWKKVAREINDALEAEVLSWRESLRQLAAITEGFMRLASTPAVVIGR